MKNPYQTFRKKNLSRWFNPNNVERYNEVFITTTPAPQLPFTINLLECNTAGGCLFDKSMCTYQSSHMSRGSTFQRVRRKYLNISKRRKIRLLQQNSLFKSKNYESLKGNFATFVILKLLIFKFSYHQRCV